MNRFWIVIFCITLFSCQEEVNLPLATIDGEIPVIEATWTNESYYNEVKISLAKNYYDTTGTQVINDAQVFITVPGKQRRVRFVYSPKSESYVPVYPNEVAQVGENYQLNVLWEGLRFESSGRLLEPPTVDSVTYEYQEDRIFRDEGYYIKVYGKIPFTEDNFYRIRVIENDTLKNDRDDYLLFDDTFGLTFFEEGLELNYDFEAGDKVRLELFRMNESAFTYINQLANLLFNDGGLFSPPPQNPDTNIEVVEGDSKVLGYFNVSSVLYETVRIEPEE
ncbi:DUF4249 domain-containing protein [Algoriphagus halophytocola]|uniref:DUF4249 domain-containing protein n=1 Tax=Algoriphagus halophytocola TaxID=2991499 RepID=A0ABY6ML29_9BACT|nr:MULTISPECIES: DUF4249 domain-containing protein [unclassified Algoriphagus]UZD23669.1 DUF4249 domain-containing protein [Algoriphagus sp. TR-M5]WBL44962.1 DUF4249 domain-containing protein [Algoriphagus sp. TR-M9]